MSRGARFNIDSQAHVCWGGGSTPGPGGGGSTPGPACCWFGCVTCHVTRSNLQTGIWCRAVSQAQAMCSAITRGDIITLRNLLRCNADPNSLDYDKRAPLHIAAAEGNLQAVSGMGLSELGLEPSSSSKTQTVNPNRKPKPKPKLIKDPKPNRKA